MSQEGYANPVTNDGPRFHSIISVSELTERVTQARANRGKRQNSAPPVVRNRGRGNAQNSKPTPTKPNGAQGHKTPKTNCLGCAGCTNARIHELRLA